MKHLIRLLTGMLLMGLALLFLFSFAKFPIIFALILSGLILLIVSYIIGYEILK